MSNTCVVVLTNPKFPVPDLRGLRAEVRFGESLEDFEEFVSRAEVILSWGGRQTELRRIFPAAPRLRWIHSMFVGVDRLLFPELVHSSVQLTNSRGAYAHSSAEFVMAAALFFAKNFRGMLDNQEKGVWESVYIEDLRDKTMGILGYGDIGRAVALLAKAFAMRIVAVRRRPELSSGEGTADRILSMEGKTELLRESDYVVLSLPSVTDTQKVIGETEILEMKDSAVLISVGRGSAIDEEALVRALRAGRIRGAALDVFEREPLPEKHPFYELPNVLLSPHCADQTPGWRERSAEVFIENFNRFQNGQPLNYVVDKELGY